MARRILLLLTILVALLAVAQADCPAGPKRLRRGHYTCFINHDLRFIVSLSNPGFQLRVPGSSCKVNGTYTVISANRIEYSPISCTSSCLQLTADANRCRFVTEGNFQIGNSCESFEAVTAKGDLYECVWVQPLNIIKYNSGIDFVDVSQAHSHALQYAGMMEFDAATHLQQSLVAALASLLVFVVVVL